MAVTYDNANSANDTGVESLTFPFVVGIGSNRLITVQGGTGDANSTNGNITAVTYAGSVLTSIWSIEDPGATWVRSQGFYRVAPTTGTNNVVVTYGGNADQTGVGAISFAGVHQTVPIGTAVKASGDTGDATTSVVSAVGDMVVAGLSTDDETTITGSGTERWAQDNVDSDTSYEGQTYAGAAPTVVVLWTQSASNNWGMGAVSIKPSEAATTSNLLTLIGAGI